MAWSQQQQQLILRLPEHLARISRKLLNKEKSKTSPMVEVRPQDENDPSNDFVFIINGKEYPALLMNLPTPLETHKTFDNKIFLKAGDIGQVLQVFDTADEREIARNNICKTLHGDYMPSGVTPPTADIVKRRFELTRKNETFLPYRIRAVIEEINSFGNGTGRMVPANYGDSAGSSGASAGGGAGGSGSSASNAAPGAMLEVVSESTTEEVVDFQEWMVDTVSQSRRTGISITLSGSELAALKDISAAAGGTSSSNSSSGARLNNTAAPLLLLLQHPEILVTEEEREEDQIDALAAEQVKEQRRKNSISLSADEASHMDVVDPSTHSISAPIATASASSVAAGSAGGTGAADNGASEPLKLSLSMRRPAASTGGTSTAQAGSSAANNAASAAGTSSTSAAAAARDQDVAMLQDEEGDENDADYDAEEGAENAAGSDEEDRPDAEGTIFDMLDDSDDEDADGADGAEGEGEGEDYDDEEEDVDGPGGGNKPAYETETRASTQYNSVVAASQVEDTAEAQEGGNGETNAGEEDVDSVNSDDSDAWMREA